MGRIDQSFFSPFIAFALVSFFIGELGDGLNIFQGIYLVNIGWNEGAVGAALSFMGLTTLLCQTAAGDIIDKTTFDRRKLLVVAAFMTACSASAVLFVRKGNSDHILMYITKIVEGLASSFIAPCLAALTLASFGPTDFDRVMANNTLWGHVGSAIAAILTGAAGYFLYPNIKYCFLVVGFSALTAIAFIGFLPEGDPLLGRGLQTTESVNAGIVNADKKEEQVVSVEVDGTNSTKGDLLLESQLQTVSSDDASVLVPSEKKEQDVNAEVDTPNTNIEKVPSSDEESILSEKKEQAVSVEGDDVYYTEEDPLLGRGLQTTESASADLDKVPSPDEAPILSEKKEQAVSAEPGAASYMSVLSDPQTLVLSLTGFFFHFANANVLLVLGELMSDNGGGGGSNRSALPLTAGAIILAQGTMTVATMAGDELTKRGYGRKPLFLICLISLPIRCWLIVFWKDKGNAYLLSTQILDGLGGGFFGLMHPYMVADITFGTGRFNLIMGVTASCFGLGATCSNFLGQMVVEHFGHIASLMGSFFISIIPIAVFTLFMPETMNTRLKDTNKEKNDIAADYVMA